MLATPLVRCSLSGTIILHDCLCVLVIVLLKHPPQGHFLFSIWQHDIFQYFDPFKLIHGPWYAKNRTNTIVGNVSPYHDTCTTMLYHLHCLLWLEFCVCRMCDILSVTIIPKKNSLAAVSPLNITPFLLRPLNVFFGKL